MTEDNDEQLEDEDLDDDQLEDDGDDNEQVPAPAQGQTAPDVERIARVCHEVNRALSQAFGDTSHVPWEQTPEALRQSVIDGVRFNVEHPDAPPSASHQRWLERKLAEGWRKGPVRDPARKVSPCLVPYAELAPEQRAKDLVFQAVVRELAR